MRRLINIYSKPSRIIIGLMSGTSHDGVDAVVARVYGTAESCRAEILHTTSTPYPKPLRERVARAFDGTTREICGLNFELGEFFAASALTAIAKAGMIPADIDVIGSHGQTIYHIPPAAGGSGSTLQIGESAVIARRTGIITVSDFRPADIAAGGQGAPLVPYADWVVFRKSGESVAVQNIGGVANVSVVTEPLSGVMGFDTGPGCALMDEAANIYTGGDIGFDTDGDIARSGDVDQEILAKLKSHPYFGEIPPKSTGREVFGRDMVISIKNESGLNMPDALRTFTELTAWSIHDAYSRFVFPYYQIDRLVLAGGGARNSFLVERVRNYFNSTDVILSDEIGIPAESRESLCFAVLANETVCGSPANVMNVTGAKYPAVLGKISF